MREALFTYNRKKFLYEMIKDWIHWIQQSSRETYYGSRRKFWIIERARVRIFGTHKRGRGKLL